MRTLHGAVWGVHTRYVALQEILLGVDEGASGERDGGCQKSKEVEQFRPGVEHALSRVENFYLDYYHI